MINLNEQTIVKSDIYNITIGVYPWDTRPGYYYDPSYQCQIILNWNRKK